MLRDCKALGFRARVGRLRIIVVRRGVVVKEENANVFWDRWLRIDTGRGYTRGFVPAVHHPSSKLEYFHIKKFSTTAIVEKQVRTRLNLYRAHTAENKPKSNHIVK
ncbi:hypothetical protein C8J57DRAFT_1229905 [Mycena rebaudengoi]|nr:hypothetical protein C8J57DRAFT_1229905 [Mycena rebaudengoi]